LNSDGDLNSNNDNLANSNDNGRMTQLARFYIMKTYKNIYYKIYSWPNIFLAYKKARKGKTKKLYVQEFEKDLKRNLQQIQFELMTFTYSPKKLVTFILRDPKTRKISKSAFRDRIVHHAIVNILEPIFDKIFIYDSCANRIGKGNLFAIKRFEISQRKVTDNLTSKAFCLKADIRHYFQEVNHKILLKIIQRKIKDEKVIWLIEKILEINNGFSTSRDHQSSFASEESFLFNKRESKEKESKGMPLGNLTSQFFANVYLNELDYFVKHKIKAKFYIRYVDDFVILHKSKEQLEIWKKEIYGFLKTKLKIELHPDKSKIMFLSKGIDFVGFRIFYYFKLLRKRSINKMKSKIKFLDKEKLIESFQGWQAYAKWANTGDLIKDLSQQI